MGERSCGYIFKAIDRSIDVLLDETYCFDGMVVLFVINIDLIFWVETPVFDPKVVYAVLNSGEATSTFCPVLHARSIRKVCSLGAKIVRAACGFMYPPRCSISGDEPSSSVRSQVASVSGFRKTNICSELLTPNVQETGFDRSPLNQRKALVSPRESASALFPSLGPLRFSAAPTSSEEAPPRLAHPQEPPLDRAFGACKLTQLPPSHRVYGPGRVGEAVASIPGGAEVGWGMGDTGVAPPLLRR